MSNEPIVYRKDGAVASIRFNRPEKKNALTVAMYEALTASLHDAAGDENIRVVALTGEGGFTAGNDIADFLAAGPAALAKPDDLAVVHFLRALAAFPKPIVAGVSGVAIGIGTTMLLHCDVVVAATTTRFSMPFTKLGLVPEGAASALFALTAGRMRASWYLLSGASFSAEEAYDMGLLTRVCDDNDVDAAVALMCGELAQLPPNAMMTTKRLIRSRFPDLVETTLRDELHEFSRALQSSEARAAFAAFMSR